MLALLDKKLETEKQTGNNRQKTEKWKPNYLLTKLITSQSLTINQQNWSYLRPPTKWPPQPHLVGVEFFSLHGVRVLDDFHELLPKPVTVETLETNRLSINTHKREIASYRKNKQQHKNKGSNMHWVGEYTLVFKAFRIEKPTFLRVQTHLTHLNLVRIKYCIIYFSLLSLNYH